MTRTLKDLADDMFKLAASYPLIVSSNMSVEVVKVILADLLARTPADTSTAISNWQIGLDRPIINTIPAYFPGKDGLTAQASRDAAWRAALSILALKKPGQQLFIGNALPYIRKLNDGSSDQAPAGFIERAELLGRLFAENSANFKAAA